MYTSSASFAPRGTIIQYGTGSSSPYAFTVWAEVSKISFTGTKYDLADVTNFQSANFKEWLPILGDSGEVGIEGNMIPDDTSEIVVINFFNNATLVPWQIVLPQSLGTFFFNGYVSSLERELPLTKQATISAKIKITGTIGFWI